MIRRFELPCLFSTESSVNFSLSLNKLQAVLSAEKRTADNGGLCLFGKD